MWVVSEYGHVQVSRPVLPNRALRQAGLLTVRPARSARSWRRSTAGPSPCAITSWPTSTSPIPTTCRACADVLAGLPGVARVLAGEERGEVDLRHERSGELVALAEPDAWFAYPFWLDDRLAPDYARTVDIHRKPGYDPCELFFDPKLWWPKGRAPCRLMQKKLGFRTLFDVVPLDATLVRGSHGLAAADPRIGRC